jgi:hypothetical protein
MSWPTVHGGGDEVEVLDELEDHASWWIVRGKPDRSSSMFWLKRPSTPCRPPVRGGHPWEAGAAVEDADVVETEEAALEHVLAEAVLTVHPPGVEEELVEDRLEEPTSTSPRMACSVRWRNRSLA